MDSVSRRRLLEVSATISSVAPIGQIQSQSNIASGGNTVEDRVDFVSLDIELSEDDVSLPLEASGVHFSSYIIDDGKLYLPNRILDGDPDALVATHAGLHTGSYPVFTLPRHQVALRSTNTGGSVVVSGSQSPIVRLYGDENISFISIGSDYRRVDSGESELYSKTLRFNFERDSVTAEFDIRLEHHESIEVIHSSEGHVFPNKSEYRNMVEQVSNVEGAQTESETGVEIQATDREDAIVADFGGDD